MTTHAIGALTVSLLVGIAPAQDVIHYKFEAGGGDNVVNYASDDPTAPREGTIAHAASIPTGGAWGPGRFGGGLAAAPQSPTSGYRVDSGWRFHIGDQLTVAFFLRMAYAIPTNENGTLLSGRGRGGFSMSMFGVSASRGWLVLELDDGQSRSTTLRRDIHALAAKDWVHVAVVLHRTMRRATWYVDGQPELPQSMSAWNDLLSASTLEIGSTDDAFWSLDEVRVSLRAATAAEIASWASAEPAAHAPFGLPCHPVGRNVLLGATGGLPTIGNGGYELTVYGLPQSVVILGLGSNNQSFGGLPLPLDLKILDPKISGCFLRSSAEFIGLGRIGPTGALAFALPIPNVPGASGAKLYSQAVLTSSVLKTAMVTNAFATVVGR